MSATFICALSTYTRDLLLVWPPLFRKFEVVYTVNYNITSGISLWLFHDEQVHELFTS